MKKSVSLCIIVFLFGLQLQLFCQTGWFIQNSGTTNTLQRVRFVDSNTGWIVGISGTILKTTNGGTNWFSQYQYNDDFIAVHMTDANTGWAVGGIAVKTSNGGVNWIPQTIGTSVTLISVYFVNQNTGWILTVDGQVFKTTNSGTNWIHLFEINDGNLYSSIFFIDLTTGWFAGGDYVSDGLIFKTTNGGANWFNQYNGPATVLLTCIVFVNQNTGYSVGNSGAILKTTNSGANWFTQISGTNVTLNSVCFVNQFYGWISANSGFMLRTTNSGTNWISQNISSYSLYNVYFVDQNTGWTIGPYGTVLKTTNGGNPVGIITHTNETPNDYLLFQNYPNPFNPSTKIVFKIPLSRGVSAGRGVSVRLVIYNILGSEAEVLVNQKLSPGFHSVEWDASSYASGVYFYRLETEDFTQTRKMVLMK